MFTVLIILHVLLAAALIVLVLLQRGPGATMGAAFGSGASGTVFGSRGAGSFLTRTTGWLAFGFFGISLTMAVMAARSTDLTNPEDDLGVVGQAVQTQEPAADEQAAGEESAVGGEEFLEAPAADDESAAPLDDESFLQPPAEDEAGQEEESEESPPEG